MNFQKINKDLIITFLLVAITGMIFFFISNQRAFLNFFYIPVLIGAYYFGKRYATQAAALSATMIFIIAYFYPHTFNFKETSELYKWLDIVTWGGFLLVTGYCMGILYDKKEEKTNEVNRTYRGIIEMLSVIIDSSDKQTQSHSYRVSVISEMIASHLSCSEHEIENIRIGALLHDIGKLGISSETLNKIGKLSSDEQNEMSKHPEIGTNVMGSSNSRVIDLLPIILHHHERYDGSGTYGLSGNDIPLGARIVAVADVYEALTADRPYRKALTPSDARKNIMDNSGTHFDPDIVKIFEVIYSSLLREGPLFPSSTLGASMVGSRN